MFSSSYLYNRKNENDFLFTRVVPYNNFNIFSQIFPFVKRSVHIFTLDYYALYFFAINSSAPVYTLFRHEWNRELHGRVQWCEMRCFVLLMLRSKIPAPIVRKSQQMLLFAILTYKIDPNRSSYGNLYN